jgi:drug/metabolite transporter superfamily protein YnfA
MSTREFPEPIPSGLDTSISSEIAGRRARTLVLHNSRIVCWMTMGMGIISALLGVCMVMMCVSLLFPVSAITFMRVLAAAQWGLGGLMMCLMLPWLWKWGATMLNSRVKLDARGVDFNLGTAKQPGKLFMAWEDVAAVQQKPMGKVREYTILGKDGSRASYTSYTFFRPTHVARKIAEHAGLTIQKVSASSP